jgi:hypothetical protein
MVSIWLHKRCYLFVIFWLRPGILLFSIEGTLLFCLLEDQRLALDFLI